MSYECIYSAIQTISMETKTDWITPLNVGFLLFTLHIAMIINRNCLGSDEIELDMLFILSDNTIFHSSINTQEKFVNEDWTHIVDEINSNLYPPTKVHKWTKKNRRVRCVECYSTHVLICKSSQQPNSVGLVSKNV